MWSAPGRAPPSRSTSPDRESRGERWRPRCGSPLVSRAAGGVEAAAQNGPATRPRPARGRNREAG
eukprot:scaffold32864_cov56-Isochrysis_galbana.AAC.1